MLPPFLSINIFIASVDLTENPDIENLENLQLKQNLTTLPIFLNSSKFEESI